MPISPLNGLLVICPITGITGISEIPSFILLTVSPETKPSSHLCCMLFARMSSEPRTQRPQALTDLECFASGCRAFRALDGFSHPVLGKILISYANPSKKTEPRPSGGPGFNGPAAQAGGRGGRGMMQSFGGRGGGRGAGPGGFGFNGPMGGRGAMGGRGGFGNASWAGRGFPGPFCCIT